MAIRVYGGDGHFEVWSEVEKGAIYTGRCIGAGDTLEDARKDAAEELRRDLAELETAEPEPWP